MVYAKTIRRLALGLILSTLISADRNFELAVYSISSGTCTVVVIVLQRANSASGAPACEGCGAP